MLSNTSGEREGNLTGNVTVAHYQSDIVRKQNPAIPPKAPNFKNMSIARCKDSVNLKMK
jgi:hypothetical protein